MQSKVYSTDKSIEIVGESPSGKVAKFNLRGVRTSLVNAVRRIVLSDVSYVATHRFDNRPSSSKGGFVVRRNTGRLHNDMLCDRIALVPIHLSRSEVANFIPGSITVLLRIKNEGEDRMDVTSQHLQTFHFAKPHPNASRCFKPCAITGDWPLITKLYPGESIDITSTLEKASASTHAAFSVVSQVSVQPELDNDAYLEARKEIQRRDLKDREMKRALNYHDTITKYKLIAKSGDEPASYLMTIESECGLTALEIFGEAIEILKTLFSSSSFSYDVCFDRGAACFTIRSRGHAFGCVVQDMSLLYKEDLEIEGIGYFQVHPLDDKIVVRVKPTSPLDAHGASDLMSRIKVTCIKEIEGLRDMFAKAVERHRRDQ